MEDALHRSNLRRSSNFKSLAILKLTEPTKSRNVLRVPANDSLDIAHKLYESRGTDNGGS